MQLVNRHIATTQPTNAKVSFISSFLWFYLFFAKLHQWYKEMIASDEAQETANGIREDLNGTPIKAKTNPRRIEDAPSLEKPKLPITAPAKAGSIVESSRIPALLIERLAMAALTIPTRSEIARANRGPFGREVSNIARFRFFIREGNSPG
jgi:hypothetical protein